MLLSLARSSCYGVEQCLFQDLKTITTRYEHVISHVLDLVAEKKERPLAQHGTQVALTTLLTTAAYQIFFNEFEPAEVNLENCYPTEAQMKARIETAFSTLDPMGRVAAECWSAYKLKLEACTNAR